MKLLSLIVFFLILNAAFSQKPPASIRAEYERLNEEAARTHSYKLSFVSLTSYRLTAGTVESILTNPAFVVSRRDGSDLALLKDWLTISKVTESLKGEKPDVRVVFTNKDDVVGFSASGEDGYWNGMPVHFSEPMQKWYSKHILPLAKALFTYPPKKK